MALINAKLALLATHFLSVASYGYSSLQASNAGDDDLGGRLRTDGTRQRALDKVGFFTQKWACDRLCIFFSFHFYYFPVLLRALGSSQQEEKEQDDDEDTNDGISDGKAKEEDQISQRAVIAVGIARGLAWLHNHNTLQLVHLNLSSSCILLDKYFEPKISNFGRAMHMITTSDAGIFMGDSEMDGWDLIKEDVHQLGVLLLELITGEDPSSNSEFFQSLERKFVQNSCPSTVSAALYCSVDKSLLGQGFDGEVLYFLKVACNCVHPLPNRRPTMVEVHKMLMAIHVPTFWAQTNISMSLAAP